MANAYTIIFVPTAFGELDASVMQDVQRKAIFSEERGYDDRTCIDAMWKGAADDRSRFTFEIEAASPDHAARILFDLTNNPSRQEDRVASGYKGYSHSKGDIYIIKDDATGEITVLFIDGMGFERITLNQALTIAYTDAKHHAKGEHGHANMGWDWVEKYVFGGQAA